VVASLAIVLLAFDGWVRHGTDIFLSAVQSGIAWGLGRRAVVGLCDKSARSAQIRPVDLPSPPSFAICLSDARTWRRLSG